MIATTEETFTVGYDEDGFMRVAGVPDAAAAERYLNDEYEGASAEWRVMKQVHVRFIESLDGRHEIWDECSARAPGAHQAWRLVDITMPEIALQEGEWESNPLYDSDRARRLRELHAEPRLAD